jgi:glutaconate CoA-transferase subunit A
MTPDLIYDQLIGAGCARALTFSWGGNPGVGSLHRLRDAVENDWPHPLRIDEHSHAGMAAAYTAGAARLPFGLLRGYAGTDLPQVNGQIRQVHCPYSGEALATVPALNPDVTILHAQAADKQGNVLIQGIVGAQKEAGLAAKTLLVTVERMVDSLDAAMNAIVLPHWVVAGIAVVPNGAYPSYAHGHYSRDNSFYLAWDEIARDRASFTAWLHRHVLDTRDHDDFLRSLREAA